MPLCKAIAGKNAATFFLTFLSVVGYHAYMKKELLEQQNKEKEYLLKEIHHRVNNNLEIVSSLLALQSAQLKDGKLADAMHKSEQRIHSMSMIHQKLYQGKSLSKIEMRDYFENLGNYIIHTFGKEDEVVL